MRNSTTFSQKLTSRFLKSIQRLLFPNDTAQKSNNCTDCPLKGITEFGYHSAINENSDPLHPAARLLEPDQELKFGSLFRCRNCSSVWHLGSNKQRMSRLGSCELTNIMAWNEQSTSLTDAQIGILEKIGATPPDGSLGRTPLDYPCRVITTDGDDIKMAIVRRHKHAPIHALGKIRYANDIKEIRTSPFALPLCIRAATVKARELRNGLNLTFIESRGKIFALAWTNHFFVQDGHISANVTHVAKVSDFEAIPRGGSGTEDLVYFLAD